jgi:hypothetical protein
LRRSTGGRKRENCAPPVEEVAGAVGHRRARQQEHERRTRNLRPLVIRHTEDLQRPGRALARVLDEVRLIEHHPGPGNENNGRLIVSPRADPVSLARMGIDPTQITNVGAFSSGQKQFLDYHREFILRRVGVSTVSPW